MLFATAAAAPGVVSSQTTTEEIARPLSSGGEEVDGG